MKTSFFRSVHITSILLSGILSFAENPIFAATVITPPEGPLIIEEFADFECSYCARSNETMTKILNTYKDQVKLVFRNAPLDFHSRAFMAAQAYTAITLQDPILAEIWRDEIFDNQPRLTSEGETYVFEVASQLGLNITKMKIDMAGPVVAKIIEQDRHRFEELGFKGTPSFLIGTESVQGARSYDDFKQIIDRQLISKLQHR